MGYLSNVSDESDHDQDGNEKAFNHPFMLKDKGPIVMNIRVRFLLYYLSMYLNLNIKKKT